MRRPVLLLALVALLAGCGDSESDSEDEQQAEAPPAKPKPQPKANPACQEPSGQEKGALRFAVRAHDREMKDSPWARVRKGGINYMAAEIDAPGPRRAVLVSYPESGGYLSAMKAINGTARTFTDLPEGGDAIPKAGEQALDCLSGA